MTRSAVKFRVVRGSAPAELLSLSGEVFKLGTLPNSDLRLDGERVARAHAVLERTAHGLRLIDLGSAFGTCLNGKPINTAIVKDGDVMTIGTNRVEVQLGNSQATRVAAGPKLDAREFEGEGAHVAEVVAMYGDTVIDVQHLGQAKDRRRQAPAWMIAGGALALCGLGLFMHDVSQDWDAHAAAVKAAAEVSAPAPAAPGTGLGGLGFGLAMLGMIPFGIAAARMQDRGRTAYVLGEGHDAALHVSGQPELPLVRGDGEYTLQFTADMTGEVTIDGQQIALDELVRTGRATRVDGNTYTVPLAASARARVRHRDLTFHINTVAPGRVIAHKSEIDKPFWFHNSLSAAAIGSLIVLTQMIPNEAGALALQEDLSDSRFVGYLSQPNQEKEPEAMPTDDEQNDSPGGVAGARHTGDEGKAGKPNSKQPTGRYAMKGPQTAVPRIARNYDPSMDARTAGVLGLMRAESGNPMASVYGDLFAQGNDDADVWGQLVGKEIGEGNGVGGLGLVGSGRGGGGSGQGTVGLASVGLIGHNRPGDGTGGLARTTGFGTRQPRVPQVRDAKAEVVGGLDKDLIRRVVRAHVNEVRHCYNMGLAKDPNMKGRVAVQFTIGNTGKVSSSVVSESDLKGDGAAVASCIAQAVRRWSFPKPASGGAALVTYPFILQAG